MIIRLSFKKYSKKNTFRRRALLRMLLLVWLSKKYFNEINIKFYKKSKYKKFHVLVKGPKCHKRGKEIFKYTYNRAFILIKYINIKKLSILQSNKYFFYMNRLFKNLTTSVYYQHRMDYISHSEFSFS